MKKNGASRTQPNPQAAALFTAGAFLFLLLVLFRLAAPFAQPAFWAAILAIAFYPLQAKLHARFGWKETRTAASVSILIMLIVLPSLIFGVAKAAEQAVQIAVSTSESIKSGHFQRETDRFFDQAWVSRAEKAVTGGNKLRRKVPKWSQSVALKMGKFAAAHAFSITKSIVFTAAKFTLMLFLLYVFLSDGKRIARYVTGLIPLESRHREKLLEETHDATRAVVQGIFAMAAVKGVLCAVLFLCVGLMIAPLLGVVAFFASIIPFAGATAVWLPVAVSLFLQGAKAKALIVLAAGVLVVNSVDNVLQPLIVGKKIKMPYALLLFAMLGGMMSYGMSGLFIGPVVLTLFFEVVPIYREKLFRHAPRAPRALKHEGDEPIKLAA